MNAAGATVLQFPCAGSVIHRRALLKGLRRALRISESPVIVDLSRCRTLGHPDIELLIDCLAQSAGCDTQVLFVARSRAVQVLLEMIRISSLASVFPSIDEALGHCASATKSSRHVWAIQSQHRGRA